MNKKFTFSTLGSTSEQKLPVGPQVFRQLKTIMVNAVLQLLPVMLFISAVLCILLSYKSANPFIAETANAMAIVMVLFTIKTLTDQTRSQNEE